MTTIGDGDDGDVAKGGTLSSSFVGGNDVVVCAYDDDVDALVLGAEAAAAALVLENGDDAMEDNDEDGDEDETSPEDATTNQIHAGAIGDR